MDNVSFDWKDYWNNISYATKVLDILQLSPRKLIEEKYLYGYLLYFLGNLKNIQAFIKLVENLPMPTNEQNDAFTVKFYALKAVYYYINIEYQKTFDACLAGEKLLEEQNIISHPAKFIFLSTKASAYADSGRYYLGLDSYDQILNDPDAPNEVKDGSQWGKGYLQIALGQYDRVNLRINEISERFKDYFLICLEQKQVKMCSVNRIIKSGYSDLLKKGMQVNLNERLLLSLIVLGNNKDIENYKNSLVGKEYLANPSQHRWAKKMFQLSLALFEPVTLDTIINIESEADWPAYDKLWFYHKKNIVLKKIFNYENIYFDKINEIYQNYPFLDPIFPCLQGDDWYPQSSWSQMLSNFYGIKETRNVSPKLVIEGSYLRYESGNQNCKLDFSRKSTSLKAIKVIAGPSGKVFSKRYIHENLTPSKYSSHLHDNRIYQLYYRIGKMLTSSNIPIAWVFSGDSHIVLKLDIVLE